MFQQTETLVLSPQFYVIYLFLAGVKSRKAFRAKLGWDPAANREQVLSAGKGRQVAGARSSCRMRTTPPPLGGCSPQDLPRSWSWAHLP